MTHHGIQESGPKLRVSEVGPPTAIVNQHVPRNQAPHCGKNLPGLQNLKDGPGMETQNFEPRTPCLLLLSRHGPFDTECADPLRTT